MGSKWDEQADVAIGILGRRGAELRGEARRYLAVAAGKGYEVAEAVALLHQHATLDGDGQAHVDSKHADRCALSSIGARRVLIGFCGAVHALANWTPESVAAECLRDGYPIVGALVSRMMMTVRFHEADAALFERLTQTLTGDEVVGLVCTTAAMVGALGFRQSGIAALDPAYAEPEGQGDAVNQGDTIDHAARAREYADSLAEKPEAD